MTISVDDLPREFDPSYYRGSNPDLAQMTAAGLQSHFAAYGEREGRPGSQGCLREHLALYAASLPSVLEIGPFCNPVLKGKNIRYFDVLDAEGLERRAKEVGFGLTVAPHIDYVSPTGDLSIVKETFPAVLSSHAIEHQPDFTGHLRQVSSILAEGGYYFLVIPDKRYCFDHYLPESNLAGIVQAHHERRKVHSLRSVIEHRTLLTHNDSQRHWKGDNSDPICGHDIAGRTAAAIAEYAKAGGGYIDVHAWQFTPKSFRHIVEVLGELGLIDLRVERVYNTPYGRNEFTAVLKK